MINIYLSDDTVQLVTGSAGRRIKVKSLATKEVHESLSTSAMDLLKELKNAKESVVNFIIDSPFINSKEIALPCARKHDIRKLTKTRDTKQPHYVDMTTEEILASLAPNRDNNIQTVSKTTVMPSVFLNSLEKIATPFALKINAIFTAQECFEHYISSFGDKKNSSCFLLIDYKKTFATVAVYSHNREIYSENIIFEVSDGSEVCHQITTLAHNGIIDAKAKAGLFIEKIYLVGVTGADFDTVQKAVSEAVRVNVLRIPLLKFVKGVNSEQLEEYFPTISALSIK